jgi:hypothetical protein
MTLLPEFPRLAAIVNQVTGDEVSVNFEIHRDDVDGAVGLWQDSFMLDWQIRQATHQQQRKIDR